MRIYARSLIRRVAIAVVVLCVMLNAAGTALAHASPGSSHPRVSHAQGTVPQVIPGSDCITINASFARMNTNVAKAFGQVINTCGVDLTRGSVSANASLACAGKWAVNSFSQIVPGTWPASPPNNVQNFDMSITGQCAVCGSNGVDSFPPFTMTITLTARGTEPTNGVDTEAQPSPKWSTSMPNSPAYNPCP